MIIELPSSAPEAPRLLGEENIIPISGEAAEELDIVFGELRKDVYCERHHSRVVVDDHRRILICQDCKKAIDPFDYVKKWAQEGDRKNAALVNIAAKTKVAHTQFKILEKRIESIRASLKRLGNPQSSDERNAYRQDLLNAETASYRTPSA